MPQQDTEKTTATLYCCNNSNNGADTVDRPLVSFVLFAYNQEKYIRAAVEGAFAQTYEPLEIFISDDCSSDATFQIILDLVESYAGPHKIVARTNKTNLGLAEHISSVMRYVNGELIVSADGDDVSYPRRTERVVEQWLNNNKESGSIFSFIDTINRDGVIESHKTSDIPLKYYLHDRPVEVVRSLCSGTLGCAQAWTKDIFKIFGELDRRLIHQDITIPLRSIMLGSVTFMNEPLVLYRLGNGTLSKISYSNVRDRLSKMKKYWAARIVNYEQLDRDIYCAIERQMLCIEDVNWLRAIVNRERELARLNYLFFSEGFFSRIKAILMSSSKVPVGRKMKLMLLAFFPWLYNFKAAD